MPAIYPVFEQPLKRGDAFNGNFISRHLRQLDEIATSTNTKLLSAFIDSGTMAREALDDDTLATISVPPVMWQDSNDGLRTVRAILSAIAESGIRFESRRGDDTAACMKELRQLEDLLASAVNEANRFHLLVDM